MASTGQLRVLMCGTGEYTTGMPPLPPKRTTVKGPRSLSMLSLGCSYARPYAFPMLSVGHPYARP